MSIFEPPPVDFEHYQGFASLYEEARETDSLYLADPYRSTGFSSLQEQLQNTLESMGHIYNLSPSQRSDLRDSLKVYSDSDSDMSSVRKVESANTSFEYTSDTNKMYDDVYADMMYDDSYVDYQVDEGRLDERQYGGRRQAQIRAICWYCDQPGHKQRECPAQRNDDRDERIRQCLPDRVHEMAREMSDEELAKLLAYH